MFFGTAYRTSNHANYSELNEYQVKRIVYPELNDTLLKIKVRSRINGDSDSYKSDVFTPEEILKGAKVEVLELDYNDYYAIFCFKFLPTHFPFGVEKVYLYVKQKTEVFRLGANWGQWYTPPLFSKVCAPTNIQ